MISGSSVKILAYAELNDQTDIAIGRIIVRSNKAIAIAFFLAYAILPSPIFCPTKPLQVKLIPNGIM